MLCMKWLIIFVLILLSACIPTVTPTPTARPPTITVTPPASPSITPTQPPSPIVTPTPPSSPLATPLSQAVIPISLQNGNFEGPFTVRENSVTVAKGWGYWKLRAPYCKPGSVGCDIPCPSNCEKCGAGDQGCYWADPEFAAAYKPDYNPPRAHGGLWAQKLFIHGREGEGGLWQQIQLLIGARLTFTLGVEAWQCMDGDHCSLQAVKNGGSKTDPPADPVRALFLMNQWGCLPLDLEGPGYVRCKLWTASDRPYAMRMRVGIDLIGGTIPTATTVIWSREIESFDYWSQVIVTVTKATPGIITVFTRCAPRFDFARTNNDCYQDDAQLMIQPIGPTYRIYLPVARR